jgi:hypothetical protein
VPFIGQALVTSMNVFATVLSLVREMNVVPFRRIVTVWVFISAVHSRRGGRIDSDRWVVVKGKAGLGNRILSALAGIAYARLSGRRPYFDWADHIYSPDGSNAFPHLFRCRLSDPDDRLPASESVAPHEWRGRLGLSCYDLQAELGIRGLGQARRRLSITPGRLDYEERVVVLWTTPAGVHKLARHFPDLGRPEDLCRLMLREDLTLHPDIRTRVDRFRREHFRRPTLGVHVRLSDSSERGRLKATRKAVNRLLRKRPGLQIFLSTDNSSVRETFERNYWDVVSTPHWYPEPGLPVHLSCEPSDRLRGASDALVDLYLLAACDALVIDSGSSFARVAALLGDVPPERIEDVGQDADGHRLVMAAAGRSARSA